MVPKDIGKDYGLRPQRIYTTPPNVRRRQGPVLRQPSASEEIRLACVKGDLLKVQNVIESGRLSVNSLLDDGWSPLMIAASAARPAVLEYLLLRNADPNLVRKDSFTALMAATGSSQNRTGDILLCVTLLLQSGSFIDATDNDGMTALGYAVKENKYELAKRLIDAGADLDSLDKNGRSCLFYAAEKGYGPLARLILENGASIDIVDKNGWQAGETAVDKGHYKLGELLFRVRESRWRPGRSPALMTAFKDVPEPLITEPDPHAGEGIVNILTNIQTQVKCLSNLVNSVRLRMVQDMNTKEYEVETGKMDELVVFARSMGKSCAILSNQVSSLNILLDGDSRIVTTHHFGMNDSLKNVVTTATTTTTKRKAKKSTRESSAAAAASPPVRPARRASKSPPKSVSPSPPPTPPSPSLSVQSLNKKEVDLEVGEEEDDRSQLTTPGYIYSNYYSYYKKQQQSKGGWNMLMAGAVSVALLCCAAPHLRTRLPMMKLWRI